MHIEAFYDTGTATVSYVVHDESSGDAVIIDPVLDYEAASSTVTTASVDRIVAYVAGRRLAVRMILETHAHADHLSGARVLKRHFPEAPLAIGRRITEVQKIFKTVFALPPGFAVDGSQFDRLLEDDETVSAGSLEFRVIFTPGHTPACASYLFEDALFTGDALFMPDMGTGRCDFPGGSAEDLYRSISERIYALPDATRVLVGHDYQPGGREVAWETTVGAQKRDNVQLPAARSEADFVRFRSERDRTLAAPRLLFQSVQVNIDGGSLPAADSSRRRFLKIPINAFAVDGDGELSLQEVA